MIPFAAAACVIDLHSGVELECSLLDLSAIGFTLRLPDAWARYTPEDIARITLRFHRYNGDAACTLTPDDCAIAREVDAHSGAILRLETMQPGFRSLARQYMQAYSQYAALKAEGDDARLSQCLTGYPAEAEAVFARDWASQREAMLRSLTPDAEWLRVMARIRCLAIALNSPELYRQFLALPADHFSAWYWQSRGLAQHALAGRKLDCVYIGSAYCPLLMPDSDLLLALADKAMQEQLQPVVVLPPVPEAQWNGMLALLPRLAAWGRLHAHTPELVVNDLGLMAAIRQEWPDCFTLTLGTMLQKRRKDARMPYMQGYGGKGALLAENAVNAAHYRAFLEAFGITRYSAEACGYHQQLPPGTVSLHVPFYQTNTAGHCTLYASHIHGDRSMQQPLTACPVYCGKVTYLYPEALGIAARFNSLFGFDARCLADGAYLAAHAVPGLERLVVDLL